MGGNYNFLISKNSKKDSKIYTKKIIPEINHSSFNNFSSAVIIFKGLLFGENILSYLAIPRPFLEQVPCDWQSASNLS